MVRTHEKSTAWTSGLLAILVHVVLFGALLFSFNWKAAHTVVSVSEVELWNELPSQPAPKKTIKVKPKPPTPKIEAPEPKVEEPKPETPKVDIELEKKKKEDALKKKKLAEKKKKELAKKKKLAALQKAMLDEIDPEKQKLKALQSQIDGEASEVKRAANQGVVDEYVSKIQAKVRGNVNRSFCLDGNPELVFKVSLLPNGEFANSPALSRSSGNPACDDAVERAIIASEPFPLPSDPDAMSRFRNLNLKLRPND